jgi:Prokaryotic RING finger family 1
MRAVALRCPYCHCGIDPRDEIIRCSKCRTIHHTSCWFENQHCTIFACTGEAFLSSSLPIFTQIAAPIVLLSLALFPNSFFFVPLLIPALLCSIVVVVRFIRDLVSGRYMYLRTRLQSMLIFLGNFISFYYLIRVFAR